MQTVALDNLPQLTGYADEALDLSTPVAGATGRCPLGFGLFILVNAVLFVRPAEIVPGWEELPIYQCLILACLLASLPVVLPQLAWSSLRRSPITLCVIGLLPAIVLSHLSHGNVYDARMGAFEFFKIVVYYLLLVGLIDSPARLRLFLLIIAGLVLCTAILCLLNHHGIIDIPALDDLKEGYDEDLPVDEQGNFVIRLRAMGIFNDPNDFCLILNAAIFICLHWLIQQKTWLWKLAWALPIATLIYALTLTQSRGGFLSLLAGLIVLMFTRMKWKQATLICLLLLPAILFAFGGRLTNVDVENADDTAQGRIQLWRESLVLFHSVPVFGSGYETLADEIGLVAHNSYIHCYAELGIFGGTLFVGAFYLAMMGIKGMKGRKLPHFTDELDRLRLCLLPVLAAYMVGINSLSRPYGNATYLILGIAAVFLVLATQSGAIAPVVDFKLLRNLAAVSIGCLIYFEMFVRNFAS